MKKLAIFDCAPSHVAYVDGYNTWVEGLDFAENPYSPAYHLFKPWSQGFRDAMHEEDALAK